jgi:hypothetical protein
VSIGRWLAAGAVVVLPCLAAPEQAAASPDQAAECPLGDSLVLVANAVVDLRLELALNPVAAGTLQPGQTVRCDQSPILLLSAKAVGVPATVDLHTRRGMTVPPSVPPPVPAASSSPSEAAAASDPSAGGNAETSPTTRPRRSTTTTSTTSSTSSTSSPSSTSTSSPSTSASSNSSSSTTPTTFNPFSPDAARTPRGARPGLRVSGSLTPIELVPGTTATARFVVTNATAETMDDLVVSSGAVDGAELRGATTENGSCTVTAGEFHCHVGTLTAGASTVVTANLLVVDPTPGGMLLQRAGATSAENSAQAVISGQVGTGHERRKGGIPREVVTVTSLGMLAAAGGTIEGQRRFRRH